MRKLKNSTSCGPDGLPPVMFRNLTGSLAGPLSILFKGGLASEPSNYHPISLTSVTCKIMERVIVQHLLSYLYHNGLISHQQHGFLRCRATTTNLLESLNDQTLTLDGKDDVTVAYIDFAKAFDSVSHQKLCHKLLGYGISGNMLTWIENFLSERIQCTRVNDSLSSSRQLLSSIIQGSCLEPILFVLYINDNVKLFDEQCMCKLYADNMKLYTCTNFSDGASMLQKYLAKLVHWSQIWQLNISHKKMLYITHSQYHM